jgi:hypothetical protein
MDPETTTWSKLIDTKLLNPSVVRSIINHGHIRQEEIIYPWLNKENYFVDYVMPPTDPIFLEADPAKHTDIGAPEVWTPSGNVTIKQAAPVTKETKKIKATGIIRPLAPPKQSYKN